MNETELVEWKERQARGEAAWEAEMRYARLPDLDRLTYPEAARNATAAWDAAMRGEDQEES